MKRLSLIMTLALIIVTQTMLFAGEKPRRIPWYPKEAHVYDAPLPKDPIVDLRQEIAALKSQLAAAQEDLIKIKGSMATCYCGTQEDGRKSASVETKQD